MSLTRDQRLFISLVCNVIGILFVGWLWTNAPYIHTNTMNTSHESAIPYEHVLSSSRQLLSVDQNISLSSLGSLWLPPTPSERLDIKHDLSLNVAFNIRTHEHEWQYCKIDGDRVFNDTIQYCSQSADVEHDYHLAWTGRSARIPFYVRKMPHYMACATLPSPHYQWPSKEFNQRIHWKNMRFDSESHALKQYPSLEHEESWFDTAASDQSALSELNWAARFIPFGTKIRMALNLGADASLFHLLKHKYDVQTVNAIVPNGPRCELISERGGLCMLLDMFEPMPFAKLTFDVVHVGSIYEEQQPEQLTVLFNEVNRLVRPGGYLWMHSIWSQSQVETLRGLLITRLGYQVLYQQERPTLKTGQSGHMKREIDWDVVFVKPINATRSAKCQQFYPSKFPQVIEAEKLDNVSHRPRSPVKWFEKD